MAVISEKFIKLTKAEQHTSMKTLDYARVSKDSDYFILYTSKGALTLNGINKIYQSPSETVIFLPCSEIINIQNTSGAAVEFYIFCISGAAASLFYKQFHNPGVHIACPSAITDIFSRLCYLSTSILPDDQRIVPKLTLILLTELLFVPEAESKKTKLLPHVEAVQKLFLDNPSSFYSLNELAALTHVNKFKLTKDFKEQLGLPPMQYLLELRLKFAQNLLVSTDLSIAQIARRAGFSTSNYFIHIFKQKIAVTPTQYRRNR